MKWLWTGWKLSYAPDSSFTEGKTSDAIKLMENFILLYT